MQRLSRLIRQRIARDCTLTSDRIPLLDWSRQYLPHHTERPWSNLHRWLADELDNATRDRGRKINLVGPRGAAKSTIATLCYPLKRICEAGEPYIWLISDTKGQAQTHLENIRLELVHNTQLHAAYGAHRLARRGQWTDERLQLANGTTIEAYGTGQRLRGRRRGAKRPTLIVCDDIQNDSHTISPAQRLTSRQWFNGTLLKAGRAATNIINVGTALHREAIAMELTETPGWHSRIFQAIEQWPANMDLWHAWEKIYNQPEDPEASAKAEQFYRDHQTAMHNGAKLLWPEEEDLYRLMRIRCEEGHTAFDREKQSQPVDPDRCEWPPDYFDHDIFYRPPAPEGCITVMAFDPSKGRYDRMGDYSAFVITQLAPNGILYIHSELTREPPTQAVERGARLFREWRPAAFGIETTIFQELLLPEFQRHFHDAGLGHIQITELENTIPKPIRIRRLGPYLAQKKIRFNQYCPFNRILIDQLRDFPTAAHDDGPDALEMCLRMLEEMSATTPMRTTQMILQS
jgi:predicted phage terminase large subunit-like protein